MLSADERRKKEYFERIIWCSKGEKSGKKGELFGVWFLPQYVGNTGKISTIGGGLVFKRKKAKEKDLVLIFLRFSSVKQ